MTEVAAMAIGWAAIRMCPPPTAGVVLCRYAAAVGHHLPQLGGADELELVTTSISTSPSYVRGPP